MLHKRQTETGNGLSLFVFCGLIHPFTGERTPRTPCVASLQKKGGWSVDQLFCIFVGASVYSLGDVSPRPPATIKSSETDLPG